MKSTSRSASLPSSLKTEIMLKSSARRVQGANSKRIQQITSHWTKELLCYHAIWVKQQLWEALRPGTTQTPCGAIVSHLHSLKRKKKWRDWLHLLLAYQPCKRSQKTLKLQRASRLLNLLGKWTCYARKPSRNLIKIRTISYLTSMIARHQSKWKLHTSGPQAVKSMHSITKLSSFLWSRKSVSKTSRIRPASSRSSERSLLHSLFDRMVCANVKQWSQLYPTWIAKK